MNVRTELLRVMGDLCIETTNLNEETRLKEDLDIDSTELVEMAVVLEKRLPVVIDDTVFTRLRTFGDVEQFVQSRLSVKVAQEE
jgi:acyl carrier protein